MRPVPATCTASDLESLVARLRQIPRVASDYSVQRDEAAQDFGLDAATLDDS